MNICRRLHMAKDDEANAVLEYAKLKNLMPSEHKEHIDMIDDIISDEYRHLLEILAMIKDMKCEEMPNEVTEDKMKEIKAIAKK
jgi:rubrerythrin